MVHLYSALEIDFGDPPRHKYLNLPNLCKIIYIYYLAISCLCFVPDLE